MTQYHLDLFAVTHIHNNDYQGDRTQEQSVRILTLEYVVLNY